ncbi:MAG: rRNA pseudouridine synthase [Clostridia bacterium]|nr:rRNA pseudouridine synthase [Clostridia bacterium]
MEGIRLQKYMAACGVASRRKAELLINEGRVAVNGAVITGQGHSVRDGDVVTVDGRIITPEKNKVYILLNKPRGVVSTANDESGRKTVLDFVKGAQERLYPVGRLDYNTSGLIMLTNDGGFTKYMTHPSHNVGKTYTVTADRDVSAADIARLADGIDIGGYTTAKAGVSYLERDNKRTIKITIFEGRNRQVRRMMEALDYGVRSLRRTCIGNICDNDLREGEWRNLSSDEIRGLGYDIEQRP